MKEEQKISFWKKLKISITDFEKYQDLAAEKIIKTVGYIALLISIFSLVVAGIFTYKFSATIDDARKYISDNIDTITFADNKLTVIPKNKEKITTIENDKFNVKIIINTQTTEKEIQESIDELNTLGNGVLILPDKIMIKSEILANAYSYSYKDIAEQYNINKVDKQEVLNLLSNDVLKSFLVYFYIIIFIYMFVIYFSTALVDIIVLSVLGLLVASISRMRLKYSAIYNIASYAITLPIILNIIYFAVNAFTGFTIKYFQVMYTGIASIYIITAILMIKSDVIKKQLELAKIVEEQEKVRLELQRKEEERKETEEKERQKREEDKKRKKEGKEKSKGKKDEEPDLNVGNEPTVINEDN